MSPQGSRAGLITAVVVMSILFVVSAIFAFYYNAESRKAETANKQLTSTNQKFASSAFQQDPVYQAVDAQAGEAGKSVAEVLVQQRDDANLGMAGTTDPQAALTAYQSAVKTFKEEPSVKEAGVSVGDKPNLVVAVQELVRGLNRMSAENKALQEQLAATKAQFEQEVAQRKVVLGERDQKLAEQGKQLETALAELAQRGQAGDESVAKIQGEADRAIKGLQEQLSAQQQVVADRDTQITKLQTDLEKALIKIRQMRPEGTKENVVRQADGEIIRVPGNDNVFINLGTGDQISPGLTFEVYDRFSGVPKLGDPTATDEEDTLPQGKASIEVVRVGPRQSECRIVRRTHGQSIVERDIISNLVYDRNAKYNFVVFGDFDLDGNDVATPADTEVIRRLITQWGGQLQNAVNVNTDFVVLGAVPEVPIQDDEETATDVDRRERAQKALDAYDEVRSQAIQLNIPIMNQGRFLYYVGYYDQAKR
jgi:hypothetical protein